MAGSKKYKTDKEEGRELPCHKSSQLAVSLFRQVKKRGGRFASMKQKNYILKRAQTGRDELKPELKAAVEKARQPADQAVIYRLMQAGENYVYHIFILDETGVRLILKGTWGWVADDSPALPYDKDHWHDTAHRRREINAGLNEADQVYALKGVTEMFKRKA
jgi:hypothetical protein